MLKYQHMATSKKPPIPRFLQKAFIISTGLFFVSQLILPILQGITAVPAGARVFDVPWFYYNVAVILAPAAYAAFAYWRLSDRFGKLWRATIALMTSIALAGFATVINSLYFAITSSLFYATSNPVPYWIPYVTLMITFPVSLLAIYLVTRRISLKTVFSSQLPLKLLLLAFGLFILSLIISLFQVITQQIDEGQAVYTLVMITSPFIIVAISYKLISTKRSRSVRLLYALIAVLVLAHAYLIINSVIFTLPSILNTSIMNIENLFGPSVAILFGLYIGTLLFMRHKKLL